MAFDISKKINFTLALSGADAVKSGMRGVTDGMLDTERAASFAQKAMGALLGIGSIAAFSGIVKGGIDAAAGLHDLSIQTGLSVAALTQFKYIGDLSSTSAESVAGAANKLAKNLAMTNDEGKGAGVALKALGIDFDTFKRMSPDEQMLAVAKAMGQFKDGTDKSAAAMLLYGKQGAELLPFLGDLAEQHDQVIAKLTEEEQALRATEAAMSDAFGDNLTKINKASNDWKRDLSMGLLPALYEASEAVLGMSNGTGGLKAQIAQLARDGTLAEWARGAMVAFSYLLDVGQGLFSLLPMLGKVIAGVAAGTSTLFAGVFAAMEQLKSGNIMAAWQSLKGGFEGVRAVASETGTDIANIWGQKLLGATFRERMDDLKGTSVAAAGTKKSMDGLADVAERLEAQKKRDEQASKAAAAAQKKLNEEVERAVKAGQELIAGIAKKNSAMQLELDMGRKLTKSEEELLDLEAKLRSGKVLLSREEEVLVRKETERGRGLEANIRWMGETKKANDAYFEGLQKTTEALEDETRKQADANAAALLGKEALAQLETAKLRDRAASLERRAELALDIDFSGALTQEFRAQAIALRQLADLKDQGIHIAAAKESAAEWQKTTDSIGQGLTDSLFRAFESGKDFFATFWDGIKNLFKTTVLKMMIQPVQGAISGMVGSVLGGIPGMSAAGTAGGIGETAGGLGNMLGMAGSLGTLGSFGATGLMSTLTGTGIGTSLGAAGSLMSGGSMLGGIGMGLGAVAPYLLAAAALYSVLNKKTTPHVGGYAMADASGAITDITAQQGGRQQAETQTAVASLAAAVAGMLNTTSGTFGGAGGFGVRSVFESDNNDPSWGLFHLLQNGQKQAGSFDALGTLNKDSAAGFAQYAGMAAEGVRTALKALDLPRWAAETLDALGHAPSIETLGQAVAKINAMQTALIDMGDAVQGLGGPFDAIAALSSDAKHQLAQFAGGIEQFVAKTHGYVQAYYTEEERFAIAGAGIIKTLADAGIAAGGATRKSELRELMDSLDPGNETGRQQMAALLNVAQQYAPIGDYLEKSGITLAQLVDRMPSAQGLAGLESISQDTAAAASATAANTASVATNTERTTAAVAELQDTAETQTNVLAEGLTKMLAELRAMNERLQTIEGHMAMAEAAP